MAKITKQGARKVKEIEPEGFVTADAGVDWTPTPGRPGFLSGVSDYRLMVGDHSVRLSEAEVMDVIEAWMRAINVSRRRACSKQKSGS